MVKIVNVGDNYLITKPDIDWNAWCRAHHIKLKGSDPNDRGTDAGESRAGISSPEMAGAAARDG